MKNRINDTLKVANSALEQLGIEAMMNIARNTEVARMAHRVADALPEVLKGLHLEPETVDVTLNSGSVFVMANTLEGFEFVKGTDDADGDYWRADWRADGYDRKVLEGLQATLGKRIVSVSFNAIGFIDTYADGRVAFEVNFKI